MLDCYERKLMTEAPDLDPNFCTDCGAPRRFPTDPATCPECAAYVRICPTCIELLATLGCFRISWELTPPKNMFKRAPRALEAVLAVPRRYLLFERGFIFVEEGLSPRTMFWSDVVRASYNKEGSSGSRVGRKW